MLPRTSAAPLSLLLTTVLAACKPPAAPTEYPAPPRYCDGSPVAPMQLELAAAAYPSPARAQDVLRSDLSTQGLQLPKVYGPRLEATVSRHRVGEVLMQIGFALRGVVREPSGSYASQLATLMAPFAANIDSVIAAGGTVRLQLHCSTPPWLATHPFPHSVQTGINRASDEPVSGCSAPTDLVEWRRIMRGVGEHFSAYGARVSFSIGSEPDNYFAGSLAELLAWYAASARGLRDSTGGASFRIGGLTMVGHKETELKKAVPTLKDGTVTFTSEKQAEPITKLWIEYCAREGVPIDLVTLHQFGGSAVPAVGTWWGRTRREVSAWLDANGFRSREVELVIEDWPQWAPFTSNDTEYFAAHTASGILSMLDLSLREGAVVRPLQGFLFDFGFTPKGDAPAGFAGRVGLSNEKGLIKPVFNLHSLLREVEGALHPVDSSDPFVHAIAATGPGQATVLAVNQVPLEYQVDRLYNTYEQRPVTENHFVAEDLSAFPYDPRELISVFYKGVDPGWPALIEAYFAEPSTIDLERLSWPAPVKAQWEELRRYGRLARERRSRCTTAEVRFGLPAGRYRLEHYVLDAHRANPYTDRGPLDQRLSAAERAGKLVEEVVAVNQAYDAESGKQPDREVVLTGPGDPIAVELEPNSVHVLRLTATP